MMVTALAVAGCIYPFDIDESYYSGGLVVEGDILVGGITWVKLSTVQPLTAGSGTGEATGIVWVEDENGREYRDPSQVRGSSFRIDMTNAPVNTRYRLRIHLASPVRGSSSTAFRSEWLEVQKAPNIDAVEYDYDRDNVNLRLSLSSPGGSGCFRWDYEEIWEFHSAVFSDVMYNVGQGTFTPYSSIYEDGNPYYWCWGRASSSQVGLAIAKTTGGERLVDRPLFSIPRSDIRLQTLYYLKVTARDISETCYEFLHAIQVNSTSTGSLTTPDPSLIVGNIRSESDSTEVVTGYIEACSVAVKEIYIDNELYKQPPFSWEPVVPATDVATLDELYRLGMRPFEQVPGGDEKSYQWGSRSCIECTAAGGTKDKPDFWPTDHR